MRSDLTAMDWIIAVAPLVVLGGLILFLITRTVEFWRSHTKLLTRQTEALERIASVLEKRG